MWTGFSSARSSIAPAEPGALPATANLFGAVESVVNDLKASLTSPTPMFFPLTPKTRPCPPARKPTWASSIEAAPQAHVKQGTTRFVDALGWSPARRSPLIPTPRSRRSAKGGGMAVTVAKVPDAWR